MNSLSIIIPVLNEAAIADALKDRLARLDVYEVIIVDGDSTDGTRETLRQIESPSVRVCRAAAGRAGQMNHGARLARGDLLLFLHADTTLPDNAPALIAEAMRRHPDRRWGRFDVCFDVGGPVLDVVARAMNLRSAWTAICTGDQAMFVERAEFLALGGFAPLALMEDVELSRRLKRRSRPVRIRECVTTSSRRWRAHGTWRTIGLMWRLRWLYWRGVPTSELAARYEHSGGCRADNFCQDARGGPGENPPDP